MHGIIPGHLFFLFREVVTESTTDGTGVIWLSDLNCDGSETSILSCGVTPGIFSCNGNSDAHLSCELGTFLVLL